MSDVKKIKTDGQLHKLLQHILRETRSLKNVDYSQTYKNDVLVGGRTSEDVRIQMADKLAGCAKRRNGVKALAFLLSHSHEVETKMDRRRTEWQQENVRWLEERYGKENVLLVATNRDEKTTHIHAIVLPVVEKLFRGKFLRKGLDANTVLGDRDKMREMHDSYATAMSKFGLERGENHSLKRKLTMAEMYTDKKQERDEQERKALYDRQEWYRSKIKRLVAMLKKLGIQEKESERELLK